MRTTLETADYEKLIELVRMHEFLYDASHEGHKDTQLVQTAWKSIAKEMGRRDLDGKYKSEAWKKKWKNLRDTYQKRKKEQRKYRSALGARKKIKWRWSRMMQFLDPYLDTKSIDTSTPATAEDDTASHKSSDKEDMDSELDRERQYSSWSAALSSYSFRAVPRNSTTSVDQIIEGSQAVGYPEDAFFKSCALRAKKLPFQTRSFLQLQITQLFVNAENPELPPIPITPLPSHQHFRDSSTVASDIPLQQRPAEGPACTYIMCLRSAS
ncbi:transcription factor Adf-1-like isoform X1 [Pomacea canaliculata]|uniref:transcription factor Adf-1-like isoform X1 n=1 Tax=Pomacea canaliculata TaxID=400727 RepID=UPI000D7367C3|nr:transcription factor Adf-1-like isoform X1 [Pomacea canaliculata]